MTATKLALPLLVAALLASPGYAGGLADITAESAIVVDMASGRALHEKDADARRYPASTTKIMTALLFIENVKPDAMVTAPLDVEKVTGSSLHLKPGERISAEDLLYALLLRSANDAAYAAAVHIAGSEKAFARMMTERAKQMGCTGTNFTNPHGLHDPDHYTTARDLAIIAREAMKNEVFASAAKSEFRFIERSMNDEDVFLKTHNKFLMSRNDATGIKTGWTVPAGRCFVGSAERDGLRVITVVLKSTDWKGDSDILADWAFDAWTADPVVRAGQVVSSVPVRNADRVNVQLAAVADYAVVRPRDSQASVKVVSSSVDVKLPIRAGQKVGTVTLRDQDGVDHTMEVFSATDVSPRKFALGGDPIGPSFVAFVAVLVGGAWFFRRRAQRI